MSSRNQLLSSECRRDAPVIYEAISNLKRDLLYEHYGVIKDKAIAKIEARGSLKVEYLDIVSAFTLNQIYSYIPNGTRILTAVQAGAVRLIDNVGY